MTTLRDWLLKTKFEVRSGCAREPLLTPLYLPLVGWSQRALKRSDPQARAWERWVDERTELVIDGFQGSGNSFATVAFTSCQEREVRLAHHLHAPSQILRAARLGIPLIVTIREPRAAVASLVRRWPYIPLHTGIAQYRLFYEKLLPIRDAAVVAPFSQVVDDFGVVVRAVNERYHTSFVEFRHSEANARAVRGPVRTAPGEAQRRSEIRRRLDQPRYRAELQRAARLYDRFVEHAGFETAARPPATAGAKSAGRQAPRAGVGGAAR